MADEKVDEQQHELSEQDRFLEKLLQDPDAREKLATKLDVQSRPRRLPGKAPIPPVGSL